MPKPRPAILAAVALLAGCGGGGGDGKGDGGEKKGVVTVGHNQPIAFGADEYSFEPRSIVVKSGTTGPSIVRFVLRNNGSLAHDLHVRRGGADLGGTAIFGPGKTESGQASLKPGRYEFVCTVGDHANLGMRGTLTVTSEKVERPADPDAGGEGEKEK
jgi:plastocyanin